MNKILVTLIFSSIAYGDEWESYKKKFGFHFNLKEDINRLKNFKHNSQRLADHNANPEMSWKMAENPFFHMRFEEFSKMYCKTFLPNKWKNLANEKRRELISKSTTTKPSLQFPFFTTKPTTTQAPPIQYPFGNFDATTAPLSTDFRNYMQPVQDQKACGSCWSFASMAQLEGIQKIRNSSFNTVLSPQYLVDCDLGDAGCNGGWPENALNWLKNGGKNKAASMKSYPYKASRGVCRKNLANIPLSIKNVQILPLASEKDLMIQVANFGPQIVAIFASSNFQRYGSGVFSDTQEKCFTGDCNQVNHAVVVVGYGNDPKLGDYWLIKNSWGEGWGEKGYIRMKRNVGDGLSMCNVACWPTFAY